MVVIIISIVTDHEQQICLTNFNFDRYICNCLIVRINKSIIYFKFKNRAKSSALRKEKKKVNQLTLIYFSKLLNRHYQTSSNRLMHNVYSIYTINAFCNLQIGIDRCVKLPVKSVVRNVKPSPSWIHSWQQSLYVIIWSYNGAAMSQH